MFRPHRDLLKIRILRHKVKMCINNFHILTPYVFPCTVLPHLLLSGLYIQQKPLFPEVLPVAFHGQESSGPKILHDTVVVPGSEIFLAAPEITSFQIQIFVVGFLQDLLLI